MNWVDVVIVVFVLWNIVTGFWTGLIRGAFAILGFIAGVFLAGNYASAGVRFLPFIPSPDIARIVAFAAIFLIVYAIVRFVAGLLEQISSLLFLGWLDQFGGGVLGFAKGVLIAEVCLIVGINMPFIADGIRQSQLALTLMGYLPSLLLLLPKDFQAVQQLFNR